MAYVPTLVQSVVASVTGSVTPTLVTQSAPSVPIPNGTTQGNLIVVLVSGMTMTTVGVTDSAGNTYTQLQNTSSTRFFALFYCANALAIAPGGTINVGTAARYEFRVNVMEFNSYDPVTPISSYDAAVAPGSNVASISTTPVQPYASAFGLRLDFVFWYFEFNNNAGTGFNATLGSSSVALPHTLRTSFGANSPAQSEVAETMWSNPQAITNAIPGTNPPALSATFSSGALFSLDAFTLIINGASNLPPYPPGLNGRPGFDATQSATFSWAFADPDAGDTQSAYELLITVGSSTIYDSGQVSSTGQNAVLPAGALANGVTYQWQVRTWDNHGNRGPYSSTSSFTTQGAPSVTINSPANGAAVTSPTITATWAYGTSGYITNYRLVLTNSIGGILYDSGEQAGAVTSLVVPYVLQNAQTYTLGVFAWDNVGQLSSEGVSTFTTSITPTVAPTMQVNVSTAQGAIIITYQTAAPAAGVVAADHVDVYRRNSSPTSAWIRIGSGLPTSGTFFDFGAVDETSHDYKVTAVATSGAQQDSNVVSAILVIDGVWLHCVNDPLGTAWNFHWDSGQRADSATLPITYLQFEGRSLPVAEVHATQETGQITVDLEMQLDLYNPRGSSDVNALRNIFSQRQIVCYRDHRSRKGFGMIETLDIVDEQMKFSTSLVVKLSDYSEGQPQTTPLIYGNSFEATAIPQSLSNDTPCTQVQVQSDPSNLNSMRVGWAASQPIVLLPGDVQTIPATNANQIYVVSPAGALVNWFAIAPPSAGS